jgi:hypothetical protein
MHGRVSSSALHAVVRRAAVHDALNMRACLVCMHARLHACTGLLTRLLVLSYLCFSVPCTSTADETP